jgi:hypothetical protein
MYLSTVKDQDPSVVRKTFYTNKSPNLDISDIDKAKPFYQGYHYNQKEVFANRNDDIAGSRPKKLHQPLDRQYYNLRNDDIQGSKPKCQKFTTTRESTNPLNPDYQLPKVEVRVNTPPKFIRDHISINDIDGAKPNPYTKYDIRSKTNNVEDIDGAKPKKEWIPQGKQSSLDVKDINSFWEFHSTRHTDPLSPRYKVTNQNNDLIEYGKLDNKVTVRHPKEVNKTTSSDLRTTDIQGAQASTSTQHVTKLQTRDRFIKTEDIPGAQTGTLKKGMETGRQLDPLWPTYTVPGHSEPGPIYGKNINPDAAMSKYGASINSASKIGVKGELASPTEVKSPGLAAGDAKDRRSSGSKTPLSQASQGEKRITSPLMRTGEEIIGGDKSKNIQERPGYVPARVVQNENVDTSEGAKQKTGASNENRKASNPVEGYQKSVKNFFGVGGGDDKKSSKPLSALEKFDKFVSK